MEQHHISVMISEEEIEKRVCELAAQISSDFAGETVKLICILKGSAFFACELAKRITVPVMIDFMQVSSYGSGTVSSGTVQIKKDLDEPLKDENVIIVEERGSKDLRICTLLSKPERREVEIDVAYNGFEIPDKFVVGYGLDYDQHYRNLPYVGVIESE